MTRSAFFQGSNFVHGDWSNGFGVTFSIVPDSDPLLFETVYTFSEHQQGPPGIAHGGATATLIDEAMTAAAFEVEQRPAFTVNLNINYHSPVPLKTPVTVRAYVERRERRKLFLRASITLPNDTVASSAEGLFILARTDTPDTEDTSA